MTTPLIGLFGPGQATSALIGAGYPVSKIRESAEITVGTGDATKEVDITFTADGMLIAYYCFSTVATTADHISIQHLDASNALLHDFTPSTTGMHELGNNTGRGNSFLIPLKVKTGEKIRFIKSNVSASASKFIASIVVNEVS